MFVEVKRKGGGGIRIVVVILGSVQKEGKK